MCHFINNIENKVLLKPSSFSSLLVGVKCIKIKDGVASAIFMDTPYEFVKTLAGYQCKTEGYEQELDYGIEFITFNEVRGRVNGRLMDKVKGGFHIALFAYDSTLEKVVYSGIDVGYSPMRYHYLVPAMFDKEDILFFDGYEVSVRRFTIPWLNTMNYDIMDERTARIIKGDHALALKELGNIVEKEGGEKNV